MVMVRGGRARAALPFCLLLGTICAMQHYRTFEPWGPLWALERWHLGGACVQRHIRACCGVGGGAENGG